LPKIEIRNKDIKRGDSEYRSSYNGVRWVKWKDNRIVYFLSNFHDSSEVGTVRHRQKAGTLKTIPCSKMVHDYNQYMDFVDKADQLRTTYTLDKKSKKWWHRIFWFLIDTVVTNAYIIYKQKRRRKNLKNFRLQLVNELVSYNLKPKRDRKRKEKTISPMKPNVPLEKRCNNAEHLPLRLNNHRRCGYCSNKKIASLLSGFVNRVKFHFV